MYHNPHCLRDCSLVEEEEDSSNMYTCLCGSVAAVVAVVVEVVVVVVVAVVAVPVQKKRLSSISSARLYPKSPTDRTVAASLPQTVHSHGSRVGGSGICRGPLP